MDSAELSRWLICPYCGGRLRGSSADYPAGYDILHCRCGKYPVVAGIPIIKKGTLSTNNANLSYVISQIESGQPDQALAALLIPSPKKGKLIPPWMNHVPDFKGRRLLEKIDFNLNRRTWEKHIRERLQELLCKERQKTTACDFLEWYFLNPARQQKETFDYFLYRFGNKRHLVALSLVAAALQAEGPVLDLACGCGHITRSILERAADQPVFGLDNNFFLLYVAKKWVAPQAQFICCDADTTLPFRDAFFSAVFCINAFLYFTNKFNSIRELFRTLQDEGIIVLSSLGNSLCRQYAGKLPIDGYQSLISNIPHRIVSDDEILVRYLKKLGPPMARSAEKAELSHQPMFSIAISFNEDYFMDYGRFENWPHAGVNLKINPLYKVVEGDIGTASCLLQRTFPSSYYEHKNEICKQYLPEFTKISPEVISCEGSIERTEETEKLLEKLIVLDIPDRYFEERLYH